MVIAHLRALTQAHSCQYQMDKSVEMVIARLRALTLFLIFSLESMLWLVEMSGARLRALTPK